MQVNPHLTIPCRVCNGSGREPVSVYSTAGRSAHCDTCMGTGERQSRVVAAITIACACGERYSLSAFRRLGRLCMQLVGDGNDPDTLEMRQCSACESHICVWLKDDGTPTLEG